MRFALVFSFFEKVLAVYDEKKNSFFLLQFARSFVTLEEFAGFLYIKAMQRIEKFQGYDLETVLNSMFC